MIKLIQQIYRLPIGYTQVVSAPIYFRTISNISSRMQCETVEGGLHGTKLIWVTACKMWRAGGIRYFYKGIIPGVLGVFPYAAIDMGTFEYIKMHITDRNVRLYGLHEDDAGPSSVTTAAMGGFTGALGASVVYPVNLIRTRLQSQGTVLHPRTYNGFWDAVRITVNSEGTRGLFRGLMPNLIKVVPAVSIVSFVKVIVKRH
jgi:solute carrier family 25 (mitochondrial phosphate transporter), member 23/24/25/41